MLQGQMLHGQMLPWQIQYVLDVLRNLTLKFRPNLVRNSLDTADMGKCCQDICHQDSWHMLKMVTGTFL